MTVTLIPRDEADLAEAIASARAPLQIRGGGSKAGLGMPLRGPVLSTENLSGIHLYEPEALTLVAGAGTPLATVQDLLAAHNQCLPFEPMGYQHLLGGSDQPTMGGVVACNVSGPRRVQAGACRDLMLGVRFVDGSGAVIKNGGRVMKNVTGYDLVKLMAGSFGTLGVLSEVAFKVLPRPETSMTLVLEGLEDRQAISALCAALASPFDVTGAAHVPARTQNAKAQSFIRLEGFAQSVRERAEKLAQRLKSFGTPTQSDATLWPAIRDVAALGPCEGDIWRVSVKPTDGPEVVTRVSPLAHLYDWGGGLVWLCVAPDTDVRTRLAGLPGHATLIRASEATKARFGVFEPENPVIEHLSARLRDAFDPRKILNQESAR